MNIKTIVSTFPINDPVMWVDHNDNEAWGTVAGYALNSVGETVVKVNRVMPIEADRAQDQQASTVYFHPGNRQIQLINILTGETLSR